MSSRKIIIISATSDIATALCEKWVREDYEIYGTYKTKDENYQKLTEWGVQLVFCDMAQDASVKKACESLMKICGPWDMVLFGTGTLAPVGAFTEVDIDAWVESIRINFVNLMVATYTLLPGRRRPSSSIIYFAGGGTNNAVLNYSAYTVSKIALIKMCELLDAEIDDVKFAIIGPGWVKTKAHDVTLKAGESRAGQAYSKTMTKLSNNECTPMTEVIRSIEWVLSQPKEAVGGRNFSTVYDHFDEDLVRRLLKESDLYKLRRHGNG